MNSFMHTGVSDFITPEIHKYLESLPLSESMVGYINKIYDTSTRVSMEYEFPINDTLVNKGLRYIESLLEIHDICHGKRLLNRRTKFIQYKKGSFFNKHVDAGNVSLIIQLSNPNEYTGGDLVYRIRNKVYTAQKQKYRYYLFGGKPSISHWVTELTSGKREVLSFIANFA